jgi:16S rRNA (guanine(966)-N(2))-methyltransferase RsmD
MRIISGALGGRRINPPASMPYTRPTTDMAKEGLFNILQNNVEFENLKTLDLFGGTGSISYELASRGVPDLTIVEKDAKMFDFIKNTTELLKLPQIKVVRSDVFKFIEQCNEQFDFIFAGPPYALTTIDDLPVKIFEGKLLKDNGWFVLEHTPRNNYNEIDPFAITRFLQFQNPGLLIAYPKTDFADSSMKAILCDDESEFENNHLGIPEPSGSDAVDPLEIDIVLLPLLSFDERGFRVGYGKGFYDTYLKKCRPDCIKVGLSYFEAIPLIEDANDFDVPLNYCITPQKVYVF